MPAPSLTSVFLSRRRSLIGTVFRIVRDSQIAEDLAQEAYVRTRKALENTSIDHLDAFLHQTARNLALDHERRRKTHERYEEGGISDEVVASIPAVDPSAEAAIIEREQLEALDQALQELPIRARQAWILLQQGWTYARIAEHLGVSRNTVYNDIKLVMGHCRDTLAKLEGR